MGIIGCSTESNEFLSVSDTGPFLDDITQLRHLLFSSTGRSWGRSWSRSWGRSWVPLRHLWPFSPLTYSLWCWGRSWGRWWRSWRWHGAAPIAVFLVYFFLAFFVVVSFEVERGVLFQGAGEALVTTSSLTMITLCFAYLMNVGGLGLD